MKILYPLGRTFSATVPRGRTVKLGHREFVFTNLFTFLFPRNKNHSRELQRTSVNLQTWVVTPHTSRFVTWSWETLWKNHLRKFFTSMCVLLLDLSDAWTLHYNGERREDVVHRLKLLLSYVVFDKTFEEIYHFSDKEILYHLLDHYKSRNYDDFIRTKYRFIDRYM